MGPASGYILTCPSCGKDQMKATDGGFVCQFCGWSQSHICSCQSYAAAGVWMRIRDPECPQHGRPKPKFGLIP
jgi:hypothetical protein